MFSVFNRWGDDRINTDRLLSLVLLSVSSLSFGCKTHTHGPLIFTTSPSRPHACLNTTPLQKKATIWVHCKINGYSSPTIAIGYNNLIETPWRGCFVYLWRDIKVTQHKYVAECWTEAKIGPVDWSISILTSGWFLCCSCWRFLLRGLFRGCCLSKDQPKLYTAEEGRKNRWSLLDRRFKSCYSCILEPVKWLIQHIYKVVFFSFFVEGLFFGITERPGT